ncbi:hypothetical protein R3P38DRAFT_2764618 [Favolaschia claudopus]|uniref:Uncharacterized protein n=1 Tax=Favolaschia claudopus TaxID=2862362 RepID=A0AAW0DB94_9AGAR
MSSSNSENNRVTSGAAPTQPSPSSPNTANANSNPNSNNNHAGEGLHPTGLPRGRGRGSGMTFEAAVNNLLVATPMQEIPCLGQWSADGVHLESAQGSYGAGHGAYGAGQKAAVGTAGTKSVLRRVEVEFVRADALMKGLEGAQGNRSIEEQ